MSRKPEGTYRRSVHKYLRTPTYYQSMDGTRTGGTPDAYYEGELGTLWIEWKYTPAKKPRVLPTPTALQVSWLRRAHLNGVNVAVIVGSPEGSYLFTEETAWGHEVLKPDLVFKPTWAQYQDNPFTLSRKETALWIETQVRHTA